MEGSNYGISVRSTTVSLSGTLPEKLYAIANSGFQGVEIFENDLLPFIKSPELIAKMANDLGLKILLFQPFRNFEGSPRGEIQNKIEQAKCKFELMNRLGVATMLVCSNTEANAIADDRIIIDDLSMLVEQANLFDIKIGYEALAWGTHVKSYKHAWNIVSTIDHVACGLILDSFHTLAINDSLFELSTLPADKIFFVQLADAPYLKINFLEWSRHFRCYPGDGDFDVGDFVTKILATGYSGPLSLEIFSDKLQSISPRVAAFDGILAMMHLENKITAKRKEICLL